MVWAIQINIWTDIQILHETKRHDRATELAIADKWNLEIRRKPNFNRMIVA